MSPTQTTKRTSYQKGEQRIQAILKAAEDILIDTGYHNFSLRKVATQAGISLGNLQYYFRTKQSLTSALLDNIIEDYLNVFDELRGQGSPKEQLSKIIAHVISDLNTKRTSVFFPEVWSLSNHEEGITEAMDRMYGRYRAVLRDVIMEINTDLSEPQAMLLAVYISSSMEGHTIFVGNNKPWKKQTDSIIAMATQSHLWLIENGIIPKQA